MGFIAAQKQHEKERGLAATVLLVVGFVISPFATAAPADPQAADQAYQRGLASMQAEDPKAALGWFKRSAREDDPRAKYALGVLYVQGKGTKPDAKRGAKWVSRAAKQGYVPAQRALGGLYVDGVGVEADVQKGAEWLRKAAECGDADAQASLGLLVRDGRGMPPDEVEALMWFLLAQRQVEAGELRARLNPGQRAAAEARAMAFRPKAPKWGAGGAINADLDQVFSPGRGVGSRDW